MESFLDKNNRIAVVGVSRDKSKWGYRVFHHLREEGFKVVGVNPNLSEVDGETCYADLESVSLKIDVVVTVVPPMVTEKVVKSVLHLGIKKVWMQPGSESEKAVQFCEDNGIEVVHDACMVRDGMRQEFK